MAYLVFVAVLALGVFLGRFLSLGLAPDAALYAGLAYKIHVTGDFWRLSASENFFPRFFEHPPYFFQWGALLFDIFPMSDGVARLMGGVPSLLGLWLLLFYFYRRQEALWGGVAVLLLLVTGHFTKYAATSLLEGPLFLGTVMVFIASLEIKKLPANPKFFALAVVGAFVCTAFKGVAGFGAALGFFVMALSSFMGRPRFRSFLTYFVVGLSFLLPFGLWAFKTYSPQSEEWDFLRYFKEQVLRSATSNRANSAHSLYGSRFYYFGVLAKNLPHLVLLSIFGALTLWFKTENIKTFEKNVVRVSLLFFFCFFIPFSMVRFQLPHYLHPAYFCLALVGAFFIKKIAESPKYQDFLISVRAVPLALLWVVLISATGVLIYSQRGITKTANRGQEFMAVQSEVLASEDDARVWVSREAVDPYRMEVFSLWYFRGRTWSYLEKQSEENRPRKGDLLWDIKSERISSFGGI